MTARATVPDWRRQLRRRFDGFLFRWHARLDSDWSDRSLPLIIAGSLFVILAGLALARVRSLDPSVDLATWVQGSWLLGAGEGTTLTIPVPAVPIGHINGSLIMYPVGRVAAVLPVPEALVVIQAAALAYTVLPLWRLARRVVNLRVGAAFALVLAFALLPPLHRVNQSGFHPEALALPGFMAVWYRGLSGSVFRYGAAAAWVVLCRADFALVVTGFGVLLALSGRRRIGTATAVAAGAWTVASTFVSWLGAGDGWLLYPRAFERYGDNIGEVVGWFLTHPIDSLAAVFGRDQFAVMVALVLPLAFLPLLGLRYLAPLLPFQFLVLAGDVPGRVVEGPLAVPAIAVLTAAAAFGLASLGRPTVERVAVHPKLSGALVAVAAVFFLLESPASLYQRPWEWGSRDLVDEARLEALAALADDASVGTTPDMLFLAAERRVICVLPRPVEATPETDEVCTDLDVYVVDTLVIPRAEIGQDRIGCSWARERIVVLPRDPADLPLGCRRVGPVSAPAT